MYVMEVEVLLTPSQVATMLQVSVKTLYNMKYKGQGPDTVKIGRLTRYRSADIDAWLKIARREGNMK